MRTVLVCVVLLVTLAGCNTKGVCVSTSKAVGEETCTDRGKSDCEKAGGTFHKYLNAPADEDAVFGAVQETCSSLGFTKNSTSTVFSKP